MSKPKKREPLSAEQLEGIASLFKTLGEPMRLRILQAVCEGPKSVGEIVEIAQSTQANVSKHLALLTVAGVLKREKDGQRVLYQVRNNLALTLCETVRSRLDI